LTCLISIGLESRAEVGWRDERKHHHASRQNVAHAGQAGDPELPAIRAEMTSGTGTTSWITYDAANSVRLQNVLVGDLHADHFLFV
jgi:hypothetical protein